MARTIRTLRDLSMPALLMAFTFALPMFALASVTS